MRIEEQELVRRILDQSPFDGEQAAKKALRATLAALGSAVTSEEGNAIADDLQADWAAPLRKTFYMGRLTPSDFYRLAAFQAGERPAVATEHVQVVCRVLGELLSESTRELLRRHVPQLFDLFGRPEPPRSEALLTRHPRPAAAEEHTLSSGRPGSRQPLSDANPEAAHSQSVARCDDPHAATRLSSGSALPR